MNPSLFEAIMDNEITRFLNFVQQNQGMLKQKTTATSDTVLHLAIRFGHMELVREIVKLCPKMVSAENKNMDTPCHEACRRGNGEVLLRLLDVDPQSSWKLNLDEQSLLSMACSCGYLDQSCLHLAALQGYTVKYNQISAFLFLSQNFVIIDLLNCQDRYGNSILHLAVKEKHYQIAEHLIRKTRVKVNARNCNRLTALDILDQVEDSGKSRSLRALLIGTGGKKSIDISAGSTKTSDVIKTTLAPLGTIKRSLQGEDLANPSKYSSPSTSSLATSFSSISSNSSPQSSAIHPFPSPDNLKYPSSCIPSRRDFDVAVIDRCQIGGRTKSDHISRLMCNTSIP
ncbi:hypothetical protein K2173_024525 [Erythroxylum novogranatense]|uniref:Uncharacterized protein n=1 Tax=Erythroxylum novogranatense TaxID=1862640 RepID=A0AAV8SUM3_9ROSI|nr:hypothetical protein K2173_024525 [Erythroxylum novogranatense]